jgi:peroxiredoxin
MPPGREEQGLRVLDLAEVKPLRFGLQPRGTPAPQWTTREWFNAPGGLRLANLRGRVVVLHAFQMLCPGCVQHGLPQAQRLRETFAASDVAVVGLHTVFEHHEAMTPPALAAFLHEWRIRFPVGVDAPGADGNALPITMQAYGLQGTPSLLLIDRAGDLRRHGFGAEPDASVAAAIASLLSEPD